MPTSILTLTIANSFGKNDSVLKIASYSELEGGQLNLVAIAVANQICAMYNLTSSDLVLHSLAICNLV